MSVLQFGRAIIPQKKCRYTYSQAEHDLIASSLLFTLYLTQRLVPNKEDTRYYDRHKWHSSKIETSNFHALVVAFCHTSKMQLGL